MDKLIEKGLTLGISLGAGFVASKVFDFAWEQVTGEAPRRMMRWMQSTSSAPWSSASPLRQSVLQFRCCPSVEPRRVCAR